MFLYSRPFASRVTALCGLFGIEVHPEEELKSSEIPQELREEIKGISYKRSILHSNYLFRMRPDKIARPQDSLSLLFYNHIPFLLRRKHKNNPFPNTLKNISL